MPQLRDAQDVARWRLCLGCGACAYICPEQRIELVEVLEEGIRPLLRPGQCGSCFECLQVCPAFESDHSDFRRVPGLIPSLKDYVGPVLEVWEGHAADAEIRFRGASGGVLTALALYGLEQGSMFGVLHIGMHPEDATRNCTKLSRTRTELLSNTGSRYSPASACDSLSWLESATAPCVFIGQPSEVTALRKAQQMRPTLHDKVGFALSFFCAGSPSRKGTLELLKSMSIDSREIAELKYRGHGWPGMFSATLKGQSQPAGQMSYEQSWSFIQAYRPFSTQLCPDGSGEDADISCGDPWYQTSRTAEAGSSLVLVRTEVGRQALHAAMRAGYLDLKPAEPWKVIESQKNLMAKRGAIGGRILALKAMRLPAPRLRGFALFKNWRRLSFAAKARSIFGTFRRIISRRYYRPLPVSVFQNSSKAPHVESVEAAQPR